MNATILLTVPNPTEVSTSVSYLVGALIALLVFVYPIYSLINPAKS